MHKVDWQYVNTAFSVDVEQAYSRPINHTRKVRSAIDMQILTHLNHNRNRFLPFDLSVNASL